MRHLKLFEEVWNSIEGEYVVLKYDKKKKKYADFIENNIGIIKKVYYPGSWFDVEYDNAPGIIIDLLKNKGQFHRISISIRSKDKKDCEAYLEAKKYNL